MSEIKGALVTLRPITKDNIEKAHEKFQQPDFWNAIQWPSPPPLDRFSYRILKTKEICMWEMVPEFTRKVAGYVGYRAQAGVPFLFILFFDKFEVSIASEALSPVIHHYFNETWVQYTDFHRDFPLGIYLDRKIAKQMHQFLIENGFEPLSFVSELDNEKMIGYELRPQTYEAYYGEDDFTDDDFSEDEELNFDY
ncbi:MAG: hypothetical protein JW841_09365 [Deltaproteobacteria bacterium]|nr:hypothetical protein [Deltaproteobacteria bacterium]